MKIKNREGRRKRGEKTRGQGGTARSGWWYPAAGLIALVVVFWAYAPCLRGAFLFDDAVLPFALPSASAPLQVWLKGVRPVLMASYWINSRISGDQSTYSYHIVNVLIHLVAGGLIYLIVRRFLQWTETPAPRREVLSAFTAALFLLHPVQTEAVAYLAGRSEALSVTIFLAAFAVFLYRKEQAIGWGALLAVVFLFGLALLSKEHTIALPALLLLTDYWWNPGFSWRGIRGNWRLYGLMVLGTLGGLAFFWQLILYSPSAGFRLRDLPWYQYFFTECRAVFVYPAEFLLPVRLSADWDFSISRTILDHGAVFGLIALLGLAGIAWCYRKRYPLATYGFFAFLVLMAPTSSILPIRDPVAERRLYLSILGLLLIVVDALRRLKMEPRKLAAILAAVLLVETIGTRARAAVWANPVSLWEDTAAKSPHKRRVLFQLASAYYDAGRYQDAVEQYRRTALQFPPDYNLLVDWALAYDRLDRDEEALDKLRQAAVLEPTAHVYTQIAMVHARRNRWADALDALAVAGRIDPGYAPIYWYRGNIEAAINQLPQAVDDYRRAMALDPALAPSVQPDLGAALARLRGGK